MISLWSQMSSSALKGDEGGGRVGTEKLIFKLS